MPRKPSRADRKLQVVIAAIGALGLVVAAAVTGGFGFVAEKSQPVLPTFHPSQQPAGESPAMQVIGGEKGSIAVGTNNGEIVGGDKTTIVQNRELTFDEKWELTGETLFDRCGGTMIRVDGKTGSAMIAKGSNAFVELPSSSTRAVWYCGEESKRELITAKKSFAAAKVSVAADGDKVTWVLFRAR